MQVLRTTLKSCRFETHSSLKNKRFKDYSKLRILWTSLSSAKLSSKRKLRALSDVVVTSKCTISTKIYLVILARASAIENLIPTRDCTKRRCHHHRLSLASKSRYSTIIKRQWLFSILMRLKNS